MGEEGLLILHDFSTESRSFIELFPRLPLTDKDSDAAVGESSVVKKMYEALRPANRLNCYRGVGVYDAVRTPMRERLFP